MPKWCIEVQWGFGSVWSQLKDSDRDTEEEAIASIEAIRRIAKETDKPWLFAYRTIPMRAAQKA